MSSHKNHRSKSLVDRIQMALRGLTQCLEGYLATLRSAGNRP